MKRLPVRLAALNGLGYLVFLLYWGCQILLVRDCSVLVEADYFNPAVTQELDRDLEPLANYFNFAADWVYTTGFFIVGVVADTMSMTSLVLLDSPCFILSLLK